MLHVLIRITLICHPVLLLQEPAWEKGCMSFYHRQMKLVSNYNLEPSLFTQHTSSILSFLWRDHRSVCWTSASDWEGIRFNPPVTSNLKDIPWQSRLEKNLCCKWQSPRQLQATALQSSGLIQSKSKASSCVYSQIIRSVWARPNCSIFRQAAEFSPRHQLKKLRLARNTFSHVSFHCGTIPPKPCGSM